MAIEVIRIANKNPVFIKKDATIRDAAKKMREHNISSLIVEGGDGEVIGIITERDITRAVGNRDLEKPVEVYSTKQVKGIIEDTTVEDALLIMVENGIRHLPIMDAKTGKIKGIISIRDLVNSILDIHFLQYGKSAEEVKGSGVTCPVCGAEIDEYGYCNCGTGSG